MNRLTPEQIAALSAKGPGPLPPLALAAAAGMVPRVHRAEYVAVGRTNGVGR